MTKKTNPYAIGMAKAMKLKKDKPPLEKETIVKAHDIARSIKKGKKKVSEKWEGKAEIKATGEYAGKSLKQLQSMLDDLKKSGPHKAGSAENKKMKQLMFAIRAKKHWKGGVKKESTEKLDEAFKLRKFVPGLGKLQAASKANAQQHRADFVRSVSPAPDQDTLVKKYQKNADRYRKIANESPAGNTHDESGLFEDERTRRKHAMKVMKQDFDFANNIGLEIISQEDPLLLIAKINNPMQAREVVNRYNARWDTGYYSMANSPWPMMYIRAGLYLIVTVKLENGKKLAYQASPAAQNGTLFNVDDAPIYRKELQRLRSFNSFNEFERNVLNKSDAEQLNELSPEGYNNVAKAAKNRIIDLKRALETAKKMGDTESAKRYEDAIAHYQNLADRTSEKHRTGISKRKLDIAKSRGAKLLPSRLRQEITTEADRPLDGDQLGPGSHSARSSRVLESWAKETVNYRYKDKSLYEIKFGKEKLSDWNQLESNLQMGKNVVINGKFSNKNMITTNDGPKMLENDKHNSPPSFGNGDLNLTYKGGKYVDNKGQEFTRNRIIKYLEMNYSVTISPTSFSKPDRPSATYFNEHGVKKMKLKKKKKVSEGMNTCEAAYYEGKSHGLGKHAYACRYNEGSEEHRRYHDGYKEGLDECYGLQPNRGLVDETIDDDMVETANYMDDNDILPEITDDGIVDDMAARSMHSGVPLQDSMNVYEEGDDNSYTASNGVHVTHNDETTTYTYAGDELEITGTQTGGAEWWVNGEWQGYATYNNGMVTFTNENTGDSWTIPQDEDSVDDWAKKILSSESTGDEESDVLDEMETELDEVSRGQWLKQQDRKAERAGKSSFDAFGQTFNTADIDEAFTFESLEKQLNALLNEDTEVSEGLNVSMSKGLPSYDGKSTDSVSVTATDDDASKLLSFIKQVGLGGLGDEAQPAQGTAIVSVSDYGAPAFNGHDDMKSMMSKMTDDNEDYKDEESDDSEQHHHQPEVCTECGMNETKCQCDEEVLETETQDQETEEVAEDDAGDSGQLDAGKSEAERDSALALGSENEEQVDEMFFFPDNRTRQEKNRDQNQPRDVLGNRPKHGIAKHGNEYKDIVKGKNQAGEELPKYYRDRFKLGKPKGELPEQMNEWANEAGKDGTEASFQRDIDFMTKVISGGLNKPKSTGQQTVPVLAQDEKRTVDHVDDWMKLAGIKK